MMDDRTARLECLKLAVAIFPRSAVDPAKAVEEIASTFYNHINAVTQADSQPVGLTARADKQQSGPARKR
jgi:hypothetical protein